MAVDVLGVSREEAATAAARAARAGDEAKVAEASAKAGLEHANPSLRAL